MAVIEWLLNIDSKIFLFLNGLNHPIFDFLMFWASDMYIWIPLYLLLIALAIYKYKWKALWIIMFGSLAIALADYASVHWFKNVFLRLRPCHEPALEGLVHMVKDKCGGQYSFVSSHATNHFAIAVFWGMILKTNFRRIGLWLILWASLVAYSRVYLGVHYPLDIIGGAMLGSLVGFIFYLPAYHLSKKNPAKAG